MSDYTFDIEPLPEIIIASGATFEGLVDQCGFTVQNPKINTWGTITHRGPRSLAMARFSRDMWWEREADEVYDRLIAKRHEYALLEDLLAAYLHAEIKKLIDRCRTLCLGTPIVGDLNPLIPHIANKGLGFQPFGGAWSKQCAILIAVIDDEPTPRSPHYPFPKQEQITTENQPHPTPDELM